jgi:hypothetical protein
MIPPETPVPDEPDAENVPDDEPDESEPELPLELPSAEA